MNQKILNRTIKLAHAICPTNRSMRTSHVAFLIKSGKINKIGWNKNRTSPKNLEFSYHPGRVGIHAELDCCLKTGKDDLSGYEMVVLRVNREGQISNSKPCSGCQNVLAQFGIDKIYYSNQFGEIVKI
jgi:deoxycytidylate deaminase